VVVFLHPSDSACLPHTPHKRPLPLYRILGSFRSYECRFPKTNFTGTVKTSCLCGSRNSVVVCANVQIWTWNPFDFPNNYLIVHSSTMSYLFFTLGLVSLASAAVLQLPQTIAQAIPAPSSDPLGQWINSNVSLSSAPSATISESEWIATLSGTPNLSAGMKYKCDGGKWDRNLNTQSCLSAWASIRKGAGPALTFGPRGGERPHDVGLPQRYLSCMYPWDRFHGQIDG